ncbi:broad-complex core protein-like [Uranotaenia lowii]|uniref:broad-complex core protein-like n=1 Tax=Uranotaenia lowii TaxID=190385 RepID=UPI0024796844|nr:broad-complex core protein-like [Uranotaenia lowii]XP_055593533.1 broad-complex core protein-like [Uranotaenia lowii]XP_055593540.1 broad-complex core protein-like [Uranotaenia lowii]XP_055593547.1 broad-complex core protein-like [Uranotaenia lowii]XP_055593556.1 broad-complex core protein-like [Uranotaenia lowii]XP_055593564.1 broad-complex core protein-like [Uranotaenia lowii]XP_055593571.1 broad-complex core protein-like [Uranotaenia lowii]
MSSGQSQQFCVRWNSHLGSIGAAFPQLLAGQRFVDVTLACEGHQVHCHRLVLAACSTFFENLLGENPCKHPIIILPREIKLWAIQALVDFMYKGEVNVSQAGLPDLMKCAEILKIRGLCGSDAALDLNQIASPGAGSTTSGSSSAGTTTNAQLHQHTESSSNQSGQRGSSPQRTESKGQKNSALSGTKGGNNFLNSLNLHPVASSTPSKVSSSQQQQSSNLRTCSDEGDTSDNGGCGNDMVIKTEDLVIDEDIAKSEDEDDDMEQDANEKQQAEDDEVIADDEIDEYMEDIVDQDLPSFSKHDNDDDRHSRTSNSHANAFTITITDDTSSNSTSAQQTIEDSAKRRSPKKKQPSSSSPPPSSSSSLLSILTRGSIRVKSNENLFDNYKQQQTPEHKTNKKSASRQLVFPSYGIDGSGDGDDGGGGSGDGSRLSVDDGTDPGTTGIPSSLVYNRNAMDIYVKPKKSRQGTSTSSNAEEHGSELSTDGFENIICSPNLPQLSGTVMHSYHDDDYDDDFDIQILPDDSSLTNGGDSDCDEAIYPPPLLPFTNSETSITRVPFGKSDRNNGGTELLTPMRKQRMGRGGKMVQRLSRSGSSSTISHSGEVKISSLLNGVAIPPSAFVLRNPRGNQPRSYNTDALWAALMDVKAGESIYRASQIHKVPRKTLRNWMKRWDIKSAYPMPRQLKEAAEKKRIIKELTEQSGPEVLLSHHLQQASQTQSMSTPGGQQQSRHLLGNASCAN